MKTIKIFIASSDELRPERREISDMLLDINRPLKSFGYKVEQSKWEYLDASMGPVHKQEEYNNELKTCELCIVLFWRKFGEYTESELNTAYTELCAGRNPKKLYVYFKDADTITPELNALKNEFYVRYNLAYRAFNSIDSLRVLFLRDILNYCKIDVGKIATLRDNKLLLDGYVYADTRNFPCDHDDYQFLKHFQKSDNVPVDNTDPKLKTTNIEGDIVTSKDKNETVIVRVFIASSEEVRMERMELIDMLEELNIHLAYRGIEIEAYKSQYTNSEDEYRKELSNSEVCIVLYWTKFGDYSKAEFETAYTELCAGQNPKKIYVFFKDVEPITPELQKFKTSFDNRYGHFYGKFQNVDTLRLDFLLQFEKYRSREMADIIKIRDSKIVVNGREYVDLHKVPFCGNNEDYLDLLKEIEKTQVLKFKYPEEPEFCQRLYDLQKKRIHMENNLLNTARRIRQLSDSIAHTRLGEARRLFEQGDNRGANALLDLDDTDKEVMTNIAKIDEGENARKALEVSVDMYLLKIDTIKNEMADGWVDAVIEVYERGINWMRKYLNNEKFLDVLSDYCDFLREVYKYDRAEEIARENLSVIKKLAFEERYKYEAIARNCLGNILADKKNFIDAETNYLSALELYERLSLEDHICYEPKVANIYGNLGILHYEMNQLERAETEIRRAVFSLSEFENKYLGDFSLQRAEEFYVLGIVYIRKEQYEKAVIELNSALEQYSSLECAEHGRTELKITEVLIALACAYSCIDLIKAKQIGSLLLEQLKKLPPLPSYIYDPLMARIHNTLGVISYRNKNLDEAEINFTRACETYRLLYSINMEAFSVPLSTAIFNLAAIHCENENYERAESEFSSGMSIIDSLSKEKSYCFDYVTLDAIINMGGMYKEMGKYENAIEILKFALKITQQIETVNNLNCYSDRVRIHLFLGQSFMWTLDYYNAKRELDTSMNILKTNKFDDKNWWNKSIAQLLMTNGDLCHAKEEYAKAIDYYVESIDLLKYKICGEQYIVITSIANALKAMGNTYFLWGKFEDAKMKFIEALDIHQGLTQTHKEKYSADIQELKEKIEQLSFASIEVESASTIEPPNARTSYFAYAIGIIVIIGMIYFIVQLIISFI